MAERLSKKVVILSPLSRDHTSAHLIEDDNFWVSYFAKKKVKFRVVTSEYSKGQLLKNREINPKRVSSFSESRFFKKYSRLSLIWKLLQTNIKDSLVVIQGFEEISILCFLLSNLGRNNQYVLVSTNNISKGRFHRHGMILRLILRAIFGLVDVVFCHTECEIKIIKECIQKNVNKFHIKKYHLAVAKQGGAANLNSRLIISFFGPVKHDKPLQPFLSLIHADQSELFVYVLYKPGVLNKEDEAYLKSKKNVQIYEGWLTRDDFQMAMHNSYYVFLSHNEEYEGKLSGNLCDCLAYSVPFIAQNMSPANELTDSYGNMGFITDFSDPKWMEYFLSSDPIGKRNLYLGAYKKFHQSYTYDTIVNELDRIMI